MLQVIADHADHSDPECDRRIPAAIDDPIQIHAAQTANELDGPRVHRIVVAAQQVGACDQLGYLSWTLPVADGTGVEWQREPVAPSRGEPDLILTGHLGDVVVLDSGQMPDQPCDGVGFGVESRNEVFRRQIVQGVVDEVADPRDGVDEQIDVVHTAVIALDLTADMPGKFQLTTTDPRNSARPSTAAASGRPQSSGAAPPSVGQRVEHCRGAVEVRGQPTATVAIEQWVQADVDCPGQVLVHDVVVEGQVLALRGGNALQPPAPHRRHPPGPAVSPVLPPDRVHVIASSQQGAEERDLRGRWR